MLMFYSRMGGQNTDRSSRPCSSLEEIRLVHDPHDGLTAWPSQLDLLDRSTLEAFGPAKSNPAVAAAWEAGLLSLMRIPSNPMSINPLTIKRHHDMMKRREGGSDLNLDKRDLRILAFLSRISQWDPQDGAIPGDKLFNFRKRAAALCEKWKPHLLRNYRSAPYRWYRINRFSAKLVYVGPAPDETDQELWANILGYDSRERERTESWRSVILLDGFRDDLTVLRDVLA
ncbi:hypothetical protein FA13DRAFT_100942 [Coprinellus micaceus]|uniref:Uncharacterized protein n=1 Tax=Coprinellus micaceus TaxID=71717 RepID=A0A4Y7SHX8_COPMI|nr:hypothetical protein FA13DRAFT_100942 [Coprinellus micaceus]